MLAPSSTATRAYATCLFTVDFQAWKGGRYGAPSCFEDEDVAQVRFPTWNGNTTMRDGENGAASDLRVLEPARVRVRRDGFGRLQLEVGIEERYGPVRAVRCLPLTQPEHFISLQDEEGTELGVIEDLAELDSESARAVRTELDLCYLTARVTKIHHVEARNGIITWDVTTDLGRKRVHVRDRQNIRPLPGGRTVLTDIHDGKYEIPAVEELDNDSKRWLEIEL